MPIGKNTKLFDAHLFIAPSHIQCPRTPAHDLLRPIQLNVEILQAAEKVLKKVTAITGRHKTDIKCALSAHFSIKG